MKPCKSGNEVVNSQLDAMKHRVSEAMQAEGKRKKIFSDKKYILPPSKLKQLEARHEEERIKDQEQITQLLSDFQAMKSHYAENEPDLSKRKPQSAMNFSTSTRTDRFNKQMYIADINFNREAYNKFETVDLAFMKRQATPKYDEYAEKRKLQLLVQKRDVLSKLSTIQRAELYEQKDETANRRTYEPSVNSAAVSQASWATFASSRPSTDGSTARSHPRSGRVIIPMLKMAQLQY
eukprot:gene12683-26712_t